MSLVVQFFKLFKKVNILRRENSKILPIKLIPRKIFSSRIYEHMIKIGGEYYGQDGKTKAAL